MVIDLLNAPDHHDGPISDKNKEADAINIKSDDEALMYMDLMITACLMTPQLTQLDQLECLLMILLIWRTSMVLL